MMDYQKENHLNLDFHNDALSLTASHTFHHDMYRQLKLQRTKVSLRLSF